MDYAAIRQITEARRNNESNVKLELKVILTDSVKFELSDRWIYEFTEKGNIIYANKKIYEIHPEEFKEFCSKLLNQIKNIEKDTLKQAELWQGASALNSMFKHYNDIEYTDQDMDEYHEKVSKAYFENQEELEEFPIALITSYGTYLTEKEQKKAIDLLVEEGKKKQGDPLVITGMNNLHGFRKDGTMLFNPIDRLVNGSYYTPDEEAKNLRKTLEKYSKTTP